MVGQLVSDGPTLHDEEATDLTAAGGAEAPPMISNYMDNGQVLTEEAVKETAAVALEARATAATTGGIMEAARAALSAARTSAGQPNTGAAVFAEVIPESIHKQQDATPTTNAALDVSLPKPLPSKPTRQIDVVSAPTQ